MNECKTCNANACDSKGNNLGPRHEGVQVCPSHIGSKKSYHETINKIQYENRSVRTDPSVTDTGCCCRRRKKIRKDCCSSLYEGDPYGLLKLRNSCHCMQQKMAIDFHIPEYPSTETQVQVAPVQSAKSLGECECKDKKIDKERNSTTTQTIPPENAAALSAKTLETTGTQYSEQRMAKKNKTYSKKSIVSTSSSDERNNFKNKYPRGHKRDPMECKDKCWKERWKKYYQQSDSPEQSLNDATIIDRKDSSHIKHQARPVLSKQKDGLCKINCCKEFRMQKQNDGIKDVSTTVNSDKSKHSVKHRQTETEEKHKTNVKCLCELLKDYHNNSQCTGLQDHNCALPRYMPFSFAPFHNLILVEKK